MTTEADVKAFTGVYPSASPLVDEVGAIHAARPTPPLANPPGELVEPPRAPFDVLAVMAANAAREQAAADLAEAARLESLPPPFTGPEDVIFPKVPEKLFEELGAFVDDLTRLFDRMAAGRVTPPATATTYVKKPPESVIIYVENHGHKEVDVGASITASLAAAAAYEADIANRPRYVPKPRPPTWDYMTPIGGILGREAALARASAAVTELRTLLTDCVERYNGVARKFSGEITDYFRAVEKARTDYQDGFIDAAEQRALADDERLRAAVDAEHDRVTTLARAEKEGIK